MFDSILLPTFETRRTKTFSTLNYIGRDDSKPKWEVCLSMEVRGRAITSSDDMYIH